MLAVATACSPTAPGVTPAPAPVVPDIRWRTGEVVAYDEDTLLFILPGRALWTADVSPGTQFPFGSLTDVEAIARANLEGHKVAATIRGEELGSMQVAALSITADPIEPAEPFVPVSPKDVSVDTDADVPLFLYSQGKWHYMLTHWTAFDPTGDYSSLDELLSSGGRIQGLVIEGEGTLIYGQLTLMRSVRVTRLEAE